MTTVFMWYMTTCSTHFSINYSKHETLQGRIPYTSVIFSTEQQPSNRQFYMAQQYHILAFGFSCGLAERPRIITAGSGTWALYYMYIYIYKSLYVLYIYIIGLLPRNMKTKEKQNKTKNERVAFCPQQQLYSTVGLLTLCTW